MEQFALVGVGLRRLNGQQCIGKDSGPGASRNTDKGEATRTCGMPGAGMSYNGLHVVFDGDLATGLAPVVQAHGSIDLDRSTGSKLCPDLNGSDIPQGRTKTSRARARFGVTNGKLQLDDHSTHKPTCVSGGHVPDL